MFARLAFSVAINVNPEILIVDEALSVGDMGFQEKSITKMKEIIKQGTTVIFVSHSLSSVRNFCEKAIWMEKGQIKMIGDSTDICELYQEELHMEAVKEIEKTKFIRNDIKKSLIDKKEKKTIYVEDAYLDKKIYKTDEDITLTIKLNYTNETLDYGVGNL